MSRAVTTYNLWHALRDEGYPLQEDCRSVELIAERDGVYVLRFDVYLGADMLALVGRALVRQAEQLRKEPS